MSALDQKIYALAERQIPDIGNPMQSVQNERFRLVLEIQKLVEERANEIDAETWRTMESAPANGRKVLVVLPKGEIHFGYWDDDKYAQRPRPCWRTHSILGTRHDRENQPIAWRELPALPTWALEEILK